MSYGNSACEQLGGARGASAPACSRPVPEALERLRKSVSLLDATVAVLTDRLETVLGPENPEKEGGPGEVRVRSCEVAEATLSEAGRIDYIAGRLDRLLSRLQV